MDNSKIYNEKGERMFDISQEDGVPLLVVKTGRGAGAYRCMDAREAVEKISKAINKEG